MRYRSLGNSGLVVSVAGLGCNNFGRRLNVEATRAMVDAGKGGSIITIASTYAEVTALYRLASSALPRQQITKSSA